MKLSTALVQKYNTSGPRYTSYPTALEFHSEFGCDNYLKSLSDIQSEKLSLYIHIPFCRNICYYCACNKVITKDTTKASKYIDYLIKEMRMLAAYCASKKVGQIHFGGGTPTFLSSEQLARIMQEISSLFSIEEAAEISIEVDPRTIKPSELEPLQRLGFNRLSIGVQDFDKKVQIAVNRAHSFNDVELLLESARQLKFHSTNIDLIYGLPFQSIESFGDTIEDVIRLKPERIALYNYAHLPHRFKPQLKIKSEDLPSAEQKLGIFQQTMKQLIDAGYIYIGMDHFALPTDSLCIAQSNGSLHRNFQGYTTHGDYQLIGMGVSSISKVTDCYSQNFSDLEQYYNAIEQVQLPVWRGCNLTSDDNLRREVIMALICNFQLNIQDIESRYAIEFLNYFRSELEQLEAFIEDKLIILTEKSILVTDTGRYFIRNICMLFDSYLKEINQAQVFSKVI